MIPHMHLQSKIGNNFIDILLKEFSQEIEDNAKGTQMGIHKHSIILDENGYDNLLKRY